MKLTNKNIIKILKEARKTFDNAKDTHIYKPFGCITTEHGELHFNNYSELKEALKKSHGLALKEKVVIISKQ